MNHKERAKKGRSNRSNERVGVETSKRGRGVNGRGKRHETSRALKSWLEHETRRRRDKRKERLEERESERYGRDERGTKGEACSGIAGFNYSFFFLTLPF